MAASGDVLFCRGQDDDSNEIWDDTALIEAYDSAVNIMKTQLAEKMGIETNEINSKSENASEPGGGKKKNKKNKKKHKKKDSIEPQSMPSSNKHSEWHPGDRCRAVFTEDGVLYDAVIRSIDQEGDTCVVRYHGYGNEEQQFLADLLPAQSGRPVSSEVTSESESMDWTHAQHTAHTKPRPQPQERHSLRRGHGRGSRAPSWCPPPLMAGAPGAGLMGPGFPPMPPFMPPMAMPPTGFSHPQFPSHMPIPQMAPPPPPLPDVDILENDQEALHSMLISWYLSGYHTGFYQGIKQGKKANESFEGDAKSQKEPAHSATSGQSKNLR